MAVRTLNRSICLLSTLILLSGCGRTSSVVSPVQAAGPLPFPTFTSPGTTITLEPGVYTCLTNILPGTRIVGHGVVIPPDMITDNAFAPLPPPAPVVSIVCSGNLTLTDLTGLDISGVVFDFQNSGALFLTRLPGAASTWALATRPQRLRFKEETETMGKCLPSNRGLRNADRNSAARSD